MTVSTIGTVTEDPAGAGNLTVFGETLVGSLSPLHLGHFPYSINTQLFNTAVTGSGSVDHSGQFAQCHSGAATSSSGQLSSKNVLEYFPGMGASVRFACLFDTAVAGNTQIIGVGNDTDGFFFGYNGTSFGILTRVGSVDTWIPQASWNGDVFDGTGSGGVALDPEMGNVFQIKYQWLGFGAQRFYVENANTGTFQLAHTVHYANRNTTVSVNNPTLPFCVESKNTTNTTDIVIKNSSQAMFTEGSTGYSAFLRNAHVNTKAVTTELNVLTIRNKSTYQGITNQVLIEPDYLSLSTDGTKNVVINVYVGATLGGSPSYTDVNTANSVVDYDTAGTTVTGGKLVWTVGMAKADSLYVDVGSLTVKTPPGGMITITATSSSSNDVTAAIGWVERFA